MKLLQLLNFFKFSKSGGIKHIPIIWEDDYCQIELLPNENFGFIKQQIDKANLFAEKDETGLGYTKVFIRKENPIATISKEIRVDYLKAAIVSFQLPELKQIRYEGGEITSLRSSVVKAYGFSCFTLFFDTEEEFVKNIWLKINLITSAKEFDIILNSLYYLGEENNFILTDWNGNDIVDLKNRVQIKNYLMGWRK